MKTLKAPEGVCGVSVNGKEFNVAHGLLENLEDADAAAVLAHDSRFTVHNDGVELRTGVSADDMTRKELFAALKGLGVAASATLKTEQLLEIYKAELAKSDPQAAAKAAAEKQAAEDAAKAAAEKAAADAKAEDDAKAEADRLAAEQAAGQAGANAEDKTEPEATA